MSGKNTEESEDFYLPLPEYDDRYAYAGVQRRMMALCFDLVLFALFGMVVMTAMYETGLYHPAPMAPLPLEAWKALAILMWRSVPSFVLFAVALMLCQGILGWTPGKKLLALSVVDAKTGEPIGKIRMVLRYSLGYSLAALPFFLGFFAASSNFRKRGLHDAICGTVVLIDRAVYRQIFLNFRDACKRAIARLRKR